MTSLWALACRISSLVSPSVQARLAVAIGDHGSLTLFGNDPTRTARDALTNPTITGWIRLSGVPGHDPDAREGAWLRTNSRNMFDLRSPLGNATPGLLAAGQALRQPEWR